MPTGKSGVKAGNAFITLEAKDKTATVLKKVGARFRQWGSQIQDFGRSLITKSLAILTPLGISAAKFASFDDSMRKVQARSQGTAAEMQAIREEARRLNSETRLTADAIGGLQAKLAQKGFNRKEILDMTEGISLLAIAAGEGESAVTDLVDAADLTSTILKAFQMETKETAHVTDLLAATVNNSNSTLRGLIDSMPQAAVTAKQFNLSLEDTIALLGTLTDLSIDPSSAGTAIRNMFIKLSNAAGRDEFNKQLQR